MPRKRILVTNDDGIHAAGIAYLWKALAEDADVYVVAPETERSAAALGLTVHHPIQIQKADLGEKVQGWKVSGTPADCVRLAMSVILDSPPDLIVSGINKGSNAGRTTMYSGTVAGVIEGALRQIPGIAFSCSDFFNPDYASVQEYIAPIVAHVFEHPLPAGTILNVNFPAQAPFKGVRLARQGRGYWIEDPEERQHPDGYSYFWLGGKWQTYEEDEQSDVALLEAGFATVVPLHFHEMTDHGLLQSRKSHFDTLFTSYTETT